MTTHNRFPDRNRDQQDGIERHVYGELTYTSAAGAIIKVHGTGTTDEEVVVLRIGGVFIHMPADTDAEVFTLANSSDTQLKHALVDMPRDKQHKTTEGTNGIQSWKNPADRLEFNKKRTWLSELAQAVGRKGNFEVTPSGDTVYIRGKIIKSEVPITVGVPPFEE